MNIWWSKRFWWDSGEILVRFWWEMWEARYMMARLGWAGIFFLSLFCIQTLRFWKDRMHTFLVLFSIRSTLKIDFRRSGRRLGGQIGGHPPFWRVFLVKNGSKSNVYMFLGGAPQPRRCVNMDKPLKRKLPIHLEYRGYPPLFPHLSYWAHKTLPPAKNPGLVGISRPPSLDC